MSVDLSGYRSYRCRNLNCRQQCLRPADSEEALRGYCVNCLRDRDEAEVDLLEDVSLDSFLAILDEDHEGGPGTRPPSHGGPTRKPTAHRRASGPRTRECGQAKRSTTQSDLTDFLTGSVYGD
jgi:hypothetical protein